MKTYITDVLLKSPVPYALCTSEKLLRATLQDMGIPLELCPEFLPDNKGAVAHSFHNEQDPYHSYKIIVCIGISKSMQPIQIYSLLVHEAIHIWQAIRERMDESNPSSEFEAYSIQTISQNLMQAYDEQTKNETLPRAKK